MKFFVRNLFYGGNLSVKAVAEAQGEAAEGHIPAVSYSGVDDWSRISVTEGNHGGSVISLRFQIAVSDIHIQIGIQPISQAQFSFCRVFSAESDFTIYIGVL